MQTLHPQNLPGGARLLVVVTKYFFFLPFFGLLSFFGRLSDLIKLPPWDWRPPFENCGQPWFCAARRKAGGAKGFGNTCFMSVNISPALLLLFRDCCPGPIKLEVGKKLFEEILISQTLPSAHLLTSGILKPAYKWAGKK